jgi:transcriptional regulator with XRE-family HTH domain
MRQRQLRNRLLELMQRRERKENRRLTQHEIALYIGVTDHTISSWLKNDVTRFDRHVVEGLCEYFGCEVGDLLYLEWVEEDEPAADDSQNEDEA